MADFSTTRPDSAGADFSAARIDNRMLSDQVGSFLVREIVSGRLKQGHRINEAELARHLGISRNPIREAVKRLEERGLLTAIPRRGTFVRSFSKKDIDDIFSFRIMVEGFALEQGMTRIGPDEIDAFAAIVREMEAAADDDDEARLIERDVFFHHRLCALSENRQTLHAFSNIQSEVQILITLVEHRFETLHEAAVDHWPIVEALRTGDPARAIEALRLHITDAWRRIADEYERADAGRGAPSSSKRET